VEAVPAPLVAPAVLLLVKQMLGEIQRHWQHCGQKTKKTNNTTSPKIRGEPRCCL